MAQRKCTAPHFLIAFIAAAVSCSEARADQPVNDTQPPNVILIMTDDQGWGDFGFHGNPVIETPNLDAFAANSARLEQFYVCPVCAPTRASLMTGRYHYRTRVVDTYIGRAMMDTNETTIAEVLGAAGYATAIFGKWHLGDCYPLRPMDQGFDYSLVHRGGGIGQPSDPPEGARKYTDPVLFENGEQVQKNGYCTDIYFDTALKWIEEAKTNEKPFFAYIPTNAPHGPFHDVPQELYESYKQRELTNDQFPQDVGHPLPPADKVNEDVRARIFAMLTNIDDNVGKLMKRLDELELTDNTLVIFLVDNGPNEMRYVGGRRAMKGSVYEGGVRSPLWAHWPGHLEAGTTSDRVTAHIDLLPTIADACGVPLPDDLAIDGRSALPLLQGTDEPWPDRTVCIQVHRGDTPVKYHHFMARNQRWKLVNASGFGRQTLPDDPAQPKFELYDMVADPLEMHDVAAGHPDVLAEMKDRYEAWFADVSSTRRDNYAPPRIIIGSAHENPTTLTRQDWRHREGRPWGGGSNGVWLLEAEEAATYDVRCLFRPLSEAGGEVKLTIGSQTWTGAAQPGDEAVVFMQVVVQAGRFDLEAVLTEGEQSRGAFQVKVNRVE